MIHPKRDDGVHTRTAFWDHPERKWEGTGGDPQSGFGFSKDSPILPALRAILAMTCPAGNPHFPPYLVFDSGFSTNS
jgi:hypothetical protein